MFESSSPTLAYWLFCWAVEANPDAWAPLLIVAETVDLTPIAFRWTSRRGGCEVQAGLAFFCKFAARFAARLGFAEKLLGDRGWPTHIAQTENLDFEVAPFSPDREQIADTNFARRTSGLMIRLHAAQLAGFCGKRACLEEARRPQPFIETRAGHESSVLRAETSEKRFRLAAEEGEKVEKGAGRIFGEHYRELRGLTRGGDS